MRSLFLPQGNALTDQQFVSGALDAPLSFWKTSGLALKSAVEESALGTVVRNAQLPPLAQEITGYRGHYQTVYDTPQEVEARGDKLYATPEEYQASPFYRENVPFEKGMTESRAAALAAGSDDRHVRDYYSSKRPAAALLGGLGGAAIAPENYIPILGEASAAWTTAKLGKVAGRALISAGDAALNTAATQLALAPAREKLGDDVSWEAIGQNVAFAALAGTVLGGLGGALEARYSGTQKPSVRPANAIPEAVLDQGNPDWQISARPVEDVARETIVQDMPPVRQGAPPEEQPLPAVREQRQPEGGAGQVAPGEGAQGDVGTLYHQTEKGALPDIQKYGFTLSKGRARLGDEQMPDGVYLKPTNEDIGLGEEGDRVQLAVSAGVKNPLVLADRAALAEYLAKDEIYLGLKQEVDRLEQDSAKNETGEPVELWELRIEQAATAARARATEIIKQGGHDALILERDQGSSGRQVKSIVVLEPQNVRLLNDTLDRIETLALRGQAAQVLNDAVTSLAMDGEVKVSPNNAAAFDQLQAAAEKAVATTPRATDSPAFQQWFGDSKVTDKEGSPLVVYHGTGAVFDEFRLPENAKGDQKGIWFSADPYLPSSLAIANGTEEKGIFRKSWAGAPNVRPVYLSVKNPYRYEGRGFYDIDALKAQGYDGMVTDKIGGGENWVAFGPSQIKSVFDPGNAPPKERRFDAPPPESELEGLQSALSTVESAVRPGGRDEIETLIKSAKEEGIDPETGGNDLETDLDLLREQGLLTKEDEDALSAGKQTYEAAAAWGDVVEIARSCFLK